MANFIDRLSEQVDKKREELRRTLSEKPRAGEEQLRDLVQENWNDLPATLTQSRTRPAFAVDGSRAVRHLANGAYLFVAQGLMISENAGQRVEETDVDIQILSGATPTPFVNEAAGLMMIRLEARLARRGTQTMPKDSVLFIDGALYGIIPNLYPFREYPQYSEPEFFSDYREDALGAFLDLFKMCKQDRLILISIAKTSTESTHTKVWWQKKYKSKVPFEISDSEALYRWTNRKGEDGQSVTRAKGFSQPILLSKRSFPEGRQKEELLAREDVKNAPAIISFFVRLDDFDDALRIDVPASCIGRTETIGDVDEEQLIDKAEVLPILDLLAADYGGLEVYNALLYSVDREVRLRQDMMDQVYLSLIRNTLGSDVELRLDRSERRFHSR
jgi:hypothetical protein